MTQQRFLLEVESKKTVEPANFQRVQSAIEGLKSYGKSSFAILTSDTGDFIQVAGGRVTCIVERRVGTMHSRAYLAEKNVPFKGVQVVSCGAGEISALPEEILFAKDAVAAFRAFFSGESYPEDIFWREYNFDLESGWFCIGKPKLY